MQMTGTQRSAHEIVKRLTCDPTRRYRLFAPRLDFQENPSFPVEQLGHVRQGHLWEQLELPRFVKRAGKDAILYNPMASGPIAVKRQVLTMHDLFPLEHPEWFSRTFSAWYRYLWPRLVPRVTYVLANSEYTRQRVLDHFQLNEDRVVLCHFAHAEQFTLAPEQEVARFRAEQGLPERYLLCIGTAQLRKNLSTLVAAWRRSLAREQGVKLVIAGGDARRAIFNTTSNGESILKDTTVRLLGFFPDEKLPLLYQGAEAFALPSLAEGFGLPVLEAMACGTPVICSNTTALPEIAGGAALLVPPLEIEAWVEALDTVLADIKLRERMGAAGRKRAKDFSWLRTAETVRTVLDSI